jgi:cytochrome c553
MVQVRAAVGLALFFVAVAMAQDRIQQCNVCHGADGNSKIKNIPSLAGQPDFFILNQLVLMREGVRPIASMQPYVKDLKDSDIEAIAKHFSMVEPKPSDETIDPALIKRGGELAARLRCASCHLANSPGRSRFHA